MPGEPNPEAIAWYLQRSEAMLDELRGQVQALRSRGGQIAGFAGAVLALAGANVESILEPLQGLARAFAGTSLLIGIVLLVASLVTALRGSLRPASGFDIASGEIANYTSERFIHEPDLWRAHVRMIQGLSDSIDATAREADEAAWTARRAQNLFLVGLFSVGVGLAILIVVVTF